ncbi:MAG: GNAT family N-acetyltransferase [Promethearchaeota archaeon]
MDIKIKSLSPKLLDDFLYFFDNVAFTDNPDWGVCYCQFYHFNGSNEEWIKRTGEENRNASIEMIKSGKMNGYFAYLDNKPIGWCNANLKDNFQKVLLMEELNTTFDGKLAAILCFVISHLHRRKGIARKLLQYVCADFKDKGIDCIEAYPRKGDKLSDAHQYRGPISLYKSERFIIYKELKNFYIVRKYL